MSGDAPRAKFIFQRPTHVLKVRKTFHLTAVTATVGGDYDVAAQKLQPKWQVDTALGKAVDLRVNEDGCTVSKNWDADLGALSCNVELKAHCTWNGRPTLSIDAAPIRPLTKAVTGGVAFAVGKSMDVNPRVKLGKLPIKIEVGASIYKEGADPNEQPGDVLCLRIRSIDAHVDL